MQLNMNKPNPPLASNSSIVINQKLTLLLYKLEFLGRPQYTAADYLGFIVYTFNWLETGLTQLISFFKLCRGF